MSNTASKSRFEAIVLGALADEGWSRRGKAAFFRGEDAIINVNVQKSAFDQQRFINLGIWLLALGDADYPSHSECHLQFRLERVFDGLARDVAIATDASRSDSSGLEDLKTALERVEPDLRKLANIDELRRLASEGLLTKGLVRKEARALLSQ